MKTSLLLLCSALLLLSGCQTTETLNTWSAGSQSEKFTRVLVIAGLKEPAYRNLLEEKLVTTLKAENINAVALSTQYPDSGNIDKAQADAAVKETGADSVMVVRLVDTRKEFTHTPGTTYIPGAYGGRYGMGYFGYYGGGLMAYNTPGYTTEYNISTVETTVFSAASNQRVWSTITETTDTSVKSAIDSYCKVVGKAVKASGLF